MQRAVLLGVITASRFPDHVPIRAGPRRIVATPAGVCLHRIRNWGPSAQEDEFLPVDSQSAARAHLIQADHQRAPWLSIGASLSSPSGSR
jgi:hypothetical protein